MFAGANSIIFLINTRHFLIEINFGFFCVQQSITIYIQLEFHMAILSQRRVELAPSKSTGNFTKPQMKTKGNKVNIIIKYVKNNKMLNVKVLMDIHFIYNC